MNSQPLTKILLKIFATGFYRVHAGMFLFFFLVMFGAIEPSQFYNYEKALMLGFLSSPIFMLVVFGVWLLYMLKVIHYVSGQIFAVNQQFLFYTSNAFSKSRQFKTWAIVQLTVLLPVAGYGLLAAVVGIAWHYYLAALTILLYLTLLTAIGAGWYIRLVNKLYDGSRQSFLLKISRRWRKPFFSLYVYHVFDTMKLTYIVTKTLSWLIITAVFYLFADVSHDVRVAGIAMLAIITAHAIIIYQEHIFEEKYMAFARSLPYSYGVRFLNYLKTYFVLLIPEAIWLFARFNPLIAVELLLAGLSVALLFHCLLYHLRLDMDKYLQWIMGLFIVLFWVILYRLLWALIPLNLGVAYLIFYRKYYSVH